MSKVLVTGASGFIGGHLARHLRAGGRDVKCLVRASSRRDRLPANEFELVEGDVTDAECLRRAVADVDTVYHVAGLTCALKAQDLFRVNRDGTDNLARACAESSAPPTLLVVSSIAASGPAARDSMRREGDPPRPVSVYGESKLAGERIAVNWSERVPITIVRPGVVFGPYDFGMRPVIENLHRLRLHINPGLRSPRMSMIHVDDLCELMARAANSGERLSPDHESGEAGRGIYFGVVNEYPTYAEMGRILGSGVIPGKWMLVLRVPHIAAWTIGASSELVGHLRRRAHLLNRDKVREGMVPSWACSGEKAAQGLRFQPALPLRERLLATGSWYREHGWV